MWGSHGTNPGEFNMPWGIHVDELGDVYVVDWRNERVQKFTSEGVFLTKWDTSGSGGGQLGLPRGVAVSPDGSIYVSELRNARIQVFRRVPSSV